MLSHIGDLAGLHVKITMEFSDTKRPSHTVPNVTLLSNETKKIVELNPLARYYSIPFSEKCIQLE